MAGWLAATVNASEQLTAALALQAFTQNFSNSVPEVAACLIGKQFVYTIIKKKKQGHKKVFMCLSNSDIWQLCHLCRPGQPVPQK